MGQVLIPDNNSGKTWRPVGPPVPDRWFVFPFLLASQSLFQYTPVFADLDFEQILLRKTLVDTTGRDARWDVVRLKRIKQSFSPFDTELSEPEIQSKKEPK